MRDRRPLWMKGKNFPIVLAADFTVAANGSATLNPGTRGTTISGTNPWTLTFPQAWLATFFADCHVNPGASPAARFGQLGTINATAGTVIVNSVNGSGAAANANGDIVTVALIVGNNPSDNH